MQENTTNQKHRLLRNGGLRAAQAMLAVAALVGCDEQTPSESSTTATSDSAAAYLALSSMLDSCEQTLQTCLQQAGDDSSARAQCEATADACTNDTQGMEEQAEQTLERETRHCHKICNGDEDAGAQDDADAGSGDMEGCLTRHAPKLPKCVVGLLGCLDDAGIRERDATRTEIHACLHEAHSCFKDELAARRAERRARHHHAASEQPATAPATTTDDAADSDSSASEAQLPSEGAGGSSGEAKRHHRFVPFWKR